MSEKPFGCFGKNTKSKGASLSKDEQLKKDEAMKNFQSLAGGKLQGKQ
jgi:hypothetical protein